VLALRASHQPLRGCPYTRSRLRATARFVAQNTTQKYIFFFDFLQKKRRICRDTAFFARGIAAEPLPK
jgi:hypothetical protein